MRKRSYWFEAVLAANGILAILYFVGWWAQDERYRSPLLLFVLAAALTYIVCQMAGSWILNLAAQWAPAPPTPKTGLRVDIFVTACREPVELVCAALAAAVGIHGPTRVWLLDDGDDPALAELARQHGSGYLTASSTAMPRRATSTLHWRGRVVTSSPSLTLTMPPCRTSWRRAWGILTTRRWVLSR